MKAPLLRSVSAVLVVTTTLISMPAGVVAAPIDTETVMRDSAPAGPSVLDRDGLRALVDREDVRARLEAWGVDPADARARIDAMTDEEAATVASRFDTLPAGGDAGGIIGVLFAVFLVLLITDILGLTRVFPFTRSVR